MGSSAFHYPPLGLQAAPTLSTTTINSEGEQEGISYGKGTT